MAKAKKKSSASRLAKSMVLTDDRTVRVTVQPKTLYNLDSMQKVLAKVLKELGCQACCSGHDIRFDIQRDFVVDTRLNLRRG